LNLWKMNRESMHSDMEANLATQNQLLTAAQVKAQKAAAVSGSAETKIRMVQLVSQLEQQKAANNFKIGIAQQSTTPGGISRVDPAQLVTALGVPAERQAKVYDEIEAAQNTVKNKKAIMQSFDNASHNYSHAADFIPGVDNADQKSLHVLLGPTFKDVEGTVRQAAMDNLNKNATPQFGDDDATIAKKRLALQGYLESKASAPTAKGNGIDLSRFASTSTDPRAQFTPQESQIYQESIQRLRQNPNDQFGLAALKKLGVGK
jgi:hypothetical protein